MTTTEPTNYRTVANYSPAAVRLALPDGWDARPVPARCDGVTVKPAGWEAVHATIGRIAAATAERLLARVWGAAARKVESGGCEWDEESAA